MSELSIFEKCATIALYVTLAVIAIAAIVFFAVRKAAPDKQKSAKQITGGFLIGYAVGILVLLSYLKLDEYLTLGYIDPLTFYPVVGIFAACALLSVGGLLISIFKNSALKTYSLVSFAIVLISALALFVMNLVKTYKAGISDVTGEVLLYVFTLLIVAVIIVSALLFGKKTAKNNETKSIVYAAVCIATSFSLSYIRFFELPQGGSVTFCSLVPLMVYAYMFGSRKGVVAGAIYGLLQFIQAPWFLHPMQFLLDYPIAFAAIGLTGIFRETAVLNKNTALQFSMGAVLSVVLRYLSHVISGVFIFGSADPSYGAVAWSFLYNSFALADLAIALIAGVLLFASPSFKRLVRQNIELSSSENGTK